VPRILVADDNTNIQKMVSLAFQERGIEVTSVGNGEAAVRRLPDLNPDLILADIFMPVRNGYELCEWVKKDSKYSHIPVILLVGAFDPLDEKEARRVGADGVLKKPFIPPDPLIAMVTSTLEKNPKLAAEMATPKAVVAPPPPPPQVAVEIAPKIEVKPLPEFPEPAADDASLAYGFGAGRRGVDDEDTEESAAARAPKSEADKQAEEDFEGSSTTNDWRRSAMEFEVPEEAARQPAFSTDEEIEAPVVSEHEITPDQIPSAQAVHEIEAVIEQDAEQDAIAQSPELPHAVQDQQLPEAEDVSPD
jgi:CheY-like chemotaxis protein